MGAAAFVQSNMPLDFTARMDGAAHAGSSSASVSIPAVGSERIFCTITAASAFVSDASPRKTSPASLFTPFTMPERNAETTYGRSQSGMAASSAKPLVSAASSPRMPSSRIVMARNSPRVTVLSGLKHSAPAMRSPEKTSCSLSHMAAN